MQVESAQTGFAAPTPGSFGSPAARDLDTAMLRYLRWSVGQEVEARRRRAFAEIASPRHEHE
jgi:hypothetical protein